LADKSFEFIEKTLKPYLLQTLKTPSIFNLEQFKGTIECIEEKNDICIKKLVKKPNSEIIFSFDNKIVKIFNFLDLEYIKSLN
jgi:hypothetical protein